MSRSFDFCKLVTSNEYKIITKKQAAQMLGISERTLYRRIKSGDFLSPLQSPKGYIRGWLAGELKEYLNNLSHN